ncbi:MAG TPA: hypothetical protein VLJ58_21365 [Ramlibacter sp.]|nr:hypothetical protein [Ramlibacter sp.]
MAAAAVAGTAITAYTALNQPKPPGVKQLTAADKPPAAAKAPSRPATSTANAAAAGPGGAMSGNSGTFLTGPSGVDPSTLNLGKNTLLGQ